MVEKELMMKGLALAICSAFAKVPEIAADPALLSRAPLFARVASTRSLVEGESLPFCLGPGPGAHPPPFAADAAAVEAEQGAALDAAVSDSLEALLFLARHQGAPLLLGAGALEAGVAALGRAARQAEQLPQGHPQHPQLLGICSRAVRLLGLLLGDPSKARLAPACPPFFLARDRWDLPGRCWSRTWWCAPFWPCAPASASWPSRASRGRARTPRSCSSSRCGFCWPCSRRQAWGRRGCGPR